MDAHRSSLDAHIVGPVTYTRGDGSTADVPLGACTVSVENNVATITWGAAPEESASFAEVDLDRFENAGAIQFRK